MNFLAFCSRNQIVFMVSAVQRKEIRCVRQIANPLLIVLNAAMTDEHSRINSTIRRETVRSIIRAWVREGRVQAAEKRCVTCSNDGINDNSTDKCSAAFHDASSAVRQIGKRVLNERFCVQRCSTLGAAVRNLKWQEKLQKVRLRGRRPHAIHLKQ